ncbi:MAG: thiol reductase thioredoxin [Planctomycetota bacterium]|nr:MAG: thiol reductase thioredoxin [Planctomycetota bacterium]
MFDFAARFDDGLTYDAFLEKYGSDEHRRRWADLHARVKLTSAQQGLLAGFERDMKVLCLAGAWCGDCVNQCPIFDHFAAANSRIAVRYFDRDDHPELATELKICGGARVPVVVILSEDDFEVLRFGDKTLAKYRQMAADHLGPACPSGLGGVDQGLLDAVTQDWLDIFERAQLILRLSGRLREKHGD